jgi:hypothetical protein
VWVGVLKLFFVRKCQHYVQIMEVKIGGTYSTHGGWKIRKILIWKPVGWRCRRIWKNNIVTIYVFDYRRGTDWLLDLLTTCIHQSELHFTNHWHTQTSVLSQLQSPLAVSWQQLLTQWRFFSFLRSGSLVTATHLELLSTVNWTNWGPGWWSFHTNLLIFSSQADFQLTTVNWILSLTIQLRHSTELLTTLTNN